MKSLLFAAAAVSLLTLATTAQPHGHRHHHARDSTTTDIITDTVIVTAPEVIVWVDDHGNTVSVETRTLAPTISAQSAPATLTTASPSSSSASVTTPSSQTPVQAPATPSAPATSTEPPASPQPAETQPNVAETSTSEALDRTTTATTPPPSPASTSSVVPSSLSPSAPKSSATGTSHVQASGSGNGYGITWTPYNVDSTCKDQATINSEMSIIAGYSMIRVYGVDCNQVGTAIAAAQQYGMKVFAGLTVINTPAGVSTLAVDLASLVQQASANWGLVDTVSIGNELVNQGKNSVDEVVSAIGQAKEILSAGGYDGNVVTVDTFDIIQANPALCQASSYCAANCHAYFDAEIDAPDAGKYVYGQYQGILNTNGNRRTVITESGWPYAGDQNGAAIPSDINQQTAIAALQAAFANNKEDLILFDSFDCPWKQPGPQDVEQFFGIYGH